MFEAIRDYLQLFKEMSINKEISISGAITEPLVLVILHNSDGLSKADLGEKIYYSRSAHKSGLDRPLKNLIAENFIRKEVNENSARKNGDGAFFYFITKKGRLLFGGLTKH